MIFVTVGSMLPFDRLIEAMDTWATAHPSVEVFAQIGDGQFIPKAFQWERMITPRQFATRCQAAEVIVSHAGMGTIFSALQTRRPLVVMPRRAELREHTSNHQVATAKWLAEREGIAVVDDAEALWRVLDEKDYKAAANPLSGFASPDLINRVRSFILSS